MSFVAFDVETKTQYIGKRNLNLEFALCVLYDSDTRKFHSIWEEDIYELPSYFYEADIVVGFNNYGFDNRILKNSKAFSKGEWIDFSRKSFDMMWYIFDKHGYRPKISDLSIPSLDAGKVVIQLRPDELYESGEFDTLEDYCRQDCNLTKGIYELGLEFNSVYYEDKAKTIHMLDVDWETSKALKWRRTYLDDRRTKFKWR